MISTKGRYALRVMLDLAQHQDEHVIPLKDIATRQDISKKYLEVIVKKLVDAAFLEGTSGKGGGYRLTRKPNAYTIGEILEVMEITLAPVSCLSHQSKPCSRTNTCETLPMWKEFDQMIHNFFFTRTLEDILHP